MPLRSSPPCPLCGKPLVRLMNLFFFPLGWSPPRRVDGFCVLGEYVKPHLSDVTAMVLRADVRASRRNAAQAIGRRFATRFRLCGTPKAIAPVRLPKKRNFPADLLIHIR